MAKMAGYRRHAIVGLLAATAGVTGSFTACSDSYRSELTGSGTGPTGGTSGTGGAGGAGGMDSTGTFGEGGRCEYTCSNDLKKVLSCNGVTVEECGPEYGCVNAKCEPNPCEAAEKSKSSYGCDYWALKTALMPTTKGACFAAMIANTWELPVHINVERGGERLPVENFAYIPKWNEALSRVDYDAYDPNNGLDVGQVAVLFLSRKSAAASVEDCPKPGALDLETGVSGTGRGTAFHITTDYPVVAYQMLPYGGGKAAFTSATLLLPTSAWDTNYVAINGYSESESVSPEDYQGAYPSLAIVAHQDNTEVTIRPSVDVQGGTNVEPVSKGEAKSYSLNAGEFLQITQAEELTGSPVQSNKPIGVFGAHACMIVPNTTGDCDSGQQQIAPVRATGNEYVAVRYRNRIADREESPPWRIVGMVNGTELTWEPSRPDGAPESIELGKVYEFQSEGPFIVKSQDSNHPFYVGQYMTGGNDFMTIGDPDWVNVVPPSQYLDYYVFFTDPTYPETSLVVVRTRSKLNGEFADVELDCAGTLSGWKPVGDDYEYTIVDLTTGNFEPVGNCANGRHEMRSELPFGVTVWGWGAIQQNYRVSYAYPAGAGFLPINEVEIPPTAN
ncbi:IgGFc-binding protein [Sorangium sp. So ce1024]|uniref:IgGFc-binding protein n=1 Tax=Sorangium sp. So ce1024 TaxID=3133327 RepID=UPI003F02BAEB